MSVKSPTLAQVVISRFVGSSPTSGFMLTMQSLLRIPVSPLSLPLPHSVSLKINFKKSNKMYVGKKKTQEPLESFGGANFPRLLCKKEITFLKHPGP